MATETQPALARYHIAESILSFAGAGIAGTLWWAHRAEVDLPCTSDGGCATVAASQWAHVSFGPLHDVPVALLGLISYVALLALSMSKLASDEIKSVRWLTVAMLCVAGFGFGYSWFLQYVSFVKLNAHCIYCISSACIMTILFGTLVKEWTVLRGIPDAETPVPATESDYAKQK